MLDRISIKGFKSLRDVDVRLPRFTVLFGPNAAGKSNFLDALHFLSAAVTQRTLEDALKDPVRGYPVEAFMFPPGGLPELMSRTDVEFRLEADVSHQAADHNSIHLRYRLGVQMQPKSGKLTVTDEFLSELTQSGEPRGKARIEHLEDAVWVRKKKVGNPQQEPRDQECTVASIPSYSGEYFPQIEALRTEFGAWQTYYLDPRSAMREPSPPSQVTDIGIRGEHLAPFLYRLNHTEEYREHFEAFYRMVRAVIGSIEGIDVLLNEQRAEIELSVLQNGKAYSSRIISEGTLRVMALAAIALNPWPARLIAFEEPENGVQPIRLEHISRLLAYVAGVGRDESQSQVVVNTHSPLFVAQALKLRKNHPDHVSVIHVSNEGEGSVFNQIGDPEALFEGVNIDEMLKSDDDAVIQSMLLGGMLDA